MDFGLKNSTRTGQKYRYVVFVLPIFKVLTCEGRKSYPWFRSKENYLVGKFSFGKNVMDSYIVSYTQIQWIYDHNGIYCIKILKIDFSIFFRAFVGLVANQSPNL